MKKQTLVIGGTGAMGGAVIEQLLRHEDSSVVVPTRDSQSSHARELIERHGHRVTLVEADLSNDDQLNSLMLSVDEVFCNTNFFADNSVTAEYELGRRILDVARAHRVSRFIWSSLDDSLALTAGNIAVPHYNGKAAVASYINLMRSEEMMQKMPEPWFLSNVSILTTAPYFENLIEALAPTRGTLSDGRVGMRFTLPFGEGTYPMIALSDIGWFADYMLGNWHTWGSRDLAIVGEGLTGETVSRVFEASTGIPAEYQSLPLEVVAEAVPYVGHDLAAMSEFLQTRDVTTQDRDLEQLRFIHPALMTFSQWVTATTWDHINVDLRG